MRGDRLVGQHLQRMSGQDGRGRGDGRPGRRHRLDTRSLGDLFDARTQGVPGVTRVLVDGTLASLRFGRRRTAGAGHSFVDFPGPSRRSLRAISGGVVAVPGGHAGVLGLVIDGLEHEIGGDEALLLHRGKGLLGLGPRDAAPFGARAPIKGGRDIGPDGPDGGPAEGKHNSAVGLALKKSGLALVAKETADDEILLSGVHKGHLMGTLSVRATRHVKGVRRTLGVRGGPGGQRARGLQHANRRGSHGREHGLEIGRARRPDSARKGA